MELKEGYPVDDNGLLRRSLDGMASGVVTVDAAGNLIQANLTAIELAPGLLPGSNLRTELEKLAPVEKVDRALIRREVVSFPGKPGGPELNWLLRGTGADGEQMVNLWMVDWAEVAHERRSAFTMAASHELRGPLTTLRGFSEILNMDVSNLTPEQAEAAAIIEATTRRLTDLVEDVFDLSRNSFGELRLHLAETNLGETVKAVAAATEPGIAERDQSLEVRIEDGHPMVQADEARCFQMVSNLVNNASVHNGAGVRVRVSVGMEGDFLTVRVVDDGRGLPFEDPEEAFRSFQRGGTASEGDRTGSGIGLSLTRALIELHRGRITVESEDGSGSCFTLWFPVDRSKAAVATGSGPA